MMSYKELTESDFEGKTPSEILLLVSENEKGLKDKNTELLGTVHTYKDELGQSSKTVEEARAAALKSETAKLEALGKYEEAQTLREEERSSLVAQANEQAQKAQEALKQRDLKDVNFGILSKVQEPLRVAAEAMLKGMTDISYDENGNAKASIKYQGKEFDSVESFLEFTKTDSTWSTMIGAPNTQGLDVRKNNAQGGVIEKNQAAEAAKKSGDAIGHLNAHFKEAFKR